MHSFLDFYSDTPGKQILKGREVIKLGEEGECVCWWAFLHENVVIDVSDQFWHITASSKLQL